MNETYDGVTPEVSITRPLPLKSEVMARCPRCRSSVIKRHMMNGSFRALCPDCYDREEDER